jgi:ATP-dependent Clp protease ATP-binding subunit ClpA
MLEDFSSKAGKYIAIAESLAFDLGHCNVGSEHLLLSFLKLKDNKLKRLLEIYKIDYEKVKKELLEAFPISEELPFYMEYTIALKEILSSSSKLSKTLNEEKISEDVLMYTLIEKDNCLSREILIKYGCDIKFLLEKLQVNRVCILDNIDELINLNKKVLDNPVKVYKREKEIKIIENTLLKKQKANVLIIGEAGVGKSALVEYLAYKIVNKEVIEPLKDKIIYELDLASIVAGTKYRGEFEEKLKKILSKVKNEKNAVIFIDEIHNIVGAGGAEGAIDASNILKPYLARKDLSVIGATTNEEYTKLIEKEKAIERRFMLLKLDEVTSTDTKEILDNLKSDYEQHHNLKISKDSSDYLVNLLEKYVKEKHFPDKAIDLLDYSCVVAKNKHHKRLENLDIKEALIDLFKVDIETKNTYKLQENLKKKIIGQNEAIETICNSLELANLGLKEKNKPLGVYLFLGESGVGKSELAKELARNYFSKDDSYIKLEMEGYSEPSSISKILGSSPGYVGHEDETFILNKIRMNPSSVIILDEIEKASKEVINLFLNVLDEGYLIDAKRRKIDFSNSIIIMTSNLGFSNKKENVGFNKIERNKEELDKLIKKFFKEEFLNRIDEIIYFNSLSKEDYKTIASNYLDDTINNHLFKLDKEKLLVNFDYNCIGVRELKRRLKKEIIKEVRNCMEIKT